MCYAFVTAKPGKYSKWRCIYKVYLSMHAVECAATGQLRALRWTEAHRVRVSCIKLVGCTAGRPTDDDQGVPKTAGECLLKKRFAVRDRGSVNLLLSVDGSRPSPGGRGCTSDGQSINPSCSRWRSYPTNLPSRRRWASMSSSSLEPEMTMSCWGTKLSSGSRRS